MKLYTIDRNPNSKDPFVGGQNSTIPSPIFPHFYPRNALSMARSEHHSFEPCGQIVAFDSWKDASWRPLYWQGVSQTSHVGEGAPAPLPLPTPSLPFIPFFPPSPPSTVHPPPFPSPLLFSPLPSLSSRPLHSIPFPLELGLIIAANGSGSTLAPPAGPGRALPPNNIWFILN